MNILVPIENVPHVLMLGRRSVPLAAKVQNLLIADFLNYLALIHGTYLSTWDDGLKKSPGTGRS